jgi:hypothetical protein
MSTTFFKSLRRSSGSVLPLLLASVCLSADLAAQAPAVVSSSAAQAQGAIAYGAPWQSAVSARGDFLLFDFKFNGLYDFPANGGAQTTLIAPSPTPVYHNSGIAVDPRNNNIYLNNNYNGGLIEYPFDTATGTWDLPMVTVAQGLGGNLGGGCGNYFQSAGLAMNNNGVLAVATENGCGVEIFTVPIDAFGTFGNATPIVSNMKQRAKTVAIDNAGNISYTTDAGGFAGVGFIPAGTTALADESTVTRVDPSLGNVQGVTVDSAGNLYIVDGSAGAYFVPLEMGTPNPAHAALISPANASGGPAFDQARGILFYPTYGYGSITNAVEIYIDRLELGTSTVGTAVATPGTVTYSFNAAVTPYSFVIKENGTATGDFTLGSLAGCGITSKTDSSGNTTEVPTAYAAGGSCGIPITFTPQSVGDISAKLVMLDQAGDILATTTLHGIGQGSSAVIAPGTESTIGTALRTPAQIATDNQANLYIADSGLGKVLEYPRGSGAAAKPTSIGTGLTAPTGVAVDGAGDVFIADSGSVFEVPYGATGINTAAQFTLKSGLGTNLKLAADKVGDVFIADPDNQRVVALRNLVTGIDEVDYTGFSQISAIAADGGGDVFVASGANLIEVMPGVQTTLLSSLSGATGLAVDASGAVYVTETAGTFRIPSLGGTLTPAAQIQIAAGVTAPTSVAVDSSGNAYVADGTALDVDLVNVDGTLFFGTLTSTTGTQTATATIVDDGNLPLNVTAFSSTADFTETASTCIGSPVAVGASCTATITFNPGPGDQGALTGALTLATDAANAPIAINASGVGAALAASTSTIKVTSPSVTAAPASVTVASASGNAPVPTGNATLVVTEGGTKVLSVTAPLVNGAVLFNPTTLNAGVNVFTVNYQGDRVYGTSTASTTVTIAQGALTIVQPPASMVPTYVLASGTGAQEPYDGSDAPFDYSYPVSVVAANSAALVGTPIYNSSGKQTGTDYGIVTYEVAGGAAACQPTNVGSDGAAPLATKCFGIDTSNNQVPDLTTTYTVTPVYSGNTDPNYATVTGTPVTFIAIRNPMVIITSDPPAISLAAGSTATANLTLTSLLGYGVAGANGNLNNYSLPLQMDCSNLPPHATCSFAYPTPDASDPQSVDVNPTTPGHVVMTLNTNVPVGTSTTASITSEGPIAFAAMFGLGLVGLAFVRKRGLRTSLFSFLCLLAFSGAVAGVSACGSGSSNGAAPVLTTPAGTYSVTVTAKQTGSKTVPGSTPGTTVTVQGNGNQMSIPFSVSVTVQ